MKSIKRAAPWGAIGYILITTILLICLYNKYTEIVKINTELNTTIEECQTTISSLNTEKQELEAQVEQLQKQIQSTKISKATTTPAPKEQKAVEPTPVTTSGSQTNLGNFKISAYCHCAKCCGKSNGITATGTKVAANRTIAVDPRVIPLGSKVIIDGNTYVAEDTGGAIKGNRIDMYFATHQEALNWGIRYKDVIIVR